MRSSMQTLVFLALSSMPAAASDWYVDALSGNDTNSGSASGQSWKTLTHALSAVPNGAQLIHVAPGTYDAALGESYPLVMRPQIRIVGDQGSAPTILESAGATLLLFESLQQTTGYSFDASSGADGLTLRNSGLGIRMSTNWNPVSPTFHDLVISGMGSEGVIVDAYGFGGHLAHPTFEHVSIRGCRNAISLSGSGSSSSSFSNAYVDLTDCVLQANSANGLSLSGGHGSATANLVRCRVTGNQANGALCSASNSGSAALSAQASLFAANLDSGLRSTGSGQSGLSFQLTDCTIASHPNFGVLALPVPNFFPSTTLTNCIVFGNGDDLAVQGTLNASYTDSGDGDLIGYPNCIAADPSFVNPAGGDWRLHFESPCIDTGSPGSIGNLDLRAVVRNVDGDLDTQNAADMGAFEFQTLEKIGFVSIATDMGLKFWGPNGGSSTLYLSFSAPTAGTSTGFGTFYLNSTNLLTLGTLSSGSGPPGVLRRHIPNNPSLIGTTFSFQALTDSPLAPNGRAYTNPISFVIAP